MKRTTLILDEQCLIGLKRLAAERRQTLSALVDQFLRQGLQRARAPRRARRFPRLPAFNMGTPAVNLADRDQLESLLDGR